jgi:predicted amidohydrolase
VGDEVAYPGIARQLAADGADLLVVVSALGGARSELFDLLTRARALENGCFVVAANRCGDDGVQSFCGGSRVVGPRGDVRVDAGDQVGVAMVDIDLGDIDRVRAELPYLRGVLGD